MAGRDSAGKVVTTPEIWENNQWVQLAGRRHVQGPVLPPQLRGPEERRASSWPASGSSPAGSMSDAVTAGGPRAAGRPARATSGNSTGTTAPPRCTRRGRSSYAGGGGNATWVQSPDAKTGTPTDTAEKIDLNAASPAWTDRRLHVGSAPAPQLHDPAGRHGAGHRGHQRRRVRRHQPGGRRPGRRAVGPEDQPVDHAGRQQHDAGLPLGLAAAARRHGASRRQRQRAGRVTVPVPDEANHEIFSPPYLFKGARPTITRARRSGSE